MSAAKPGTLPRNVCHLCYRPWVDCKGTCIIGGSYAGFTDLEWRAYAEGRYTMKAPPVTTAAWGDESWMAYIFGPRTLEDFVQAAIRKHVTGGAQ